MALEVPLHILIESGTNNLGIALHPLLDTQKFYLTLSGGCDTSSEHRGRATSRTNATNGWSTAYPPNGELIKERLNQFTCCL